MRWPTRREAEIKKRVFRIVQLLYLNHTAVMDGAETVTAGGGQAARGERGVDELAAGCALAADHPGLTSEKLVHEADLQMYEAKAEHDRKTGLDRRRHFERLREHSKEDNHA